MRRTTSLRCISHVVALLALVSRLAFSQNVSSITVEAVRVTPDKFRTGQSLKIAIDVKAPPAKTGPVRAYVTVLKGDSTKGQMRFDDDSLVRISQDEPPLSSDEVRTIQFSNIVVIPEQKVPFQIIYLVAGALDPPAELAQEKVEKFNLKCPKSGSAMACKYVRSRPAQKWTWIPVD